MENENVDLLAKTDKFVVLPINKNINDIIEDVTINKNIQAPVSRGQTLGRITYFSGNEPIGEVDLIAKNDVDKKSTLSKISHPFLHPLALLCLFVCFYYGKYLLHI